MPKTPTGVRPLVQLPTAHLFVLKHLQEDNKRDLIPLKPTKTLFVHFVDSLACSSTHRPKVIGSYLADRLVIKIAPVEHS